MPPTVFLTSLNLSCKPLSKPCMIALPAGINSLRSYSIGPLWSAIHPAIPPTKSVTLFQADFNPPKNPSKIALPADQRLISLIPLKILVTFDTRSLTACFMLFHAVWAPLTIPLISPRTVDLSISHAELATLLIVSQMLDNIWENPSKIAFPADDNPFQIDSPTLFIAFQAVSQSPLITAITAVIIPPITSIAVWIAILINSQTVVTTVQILFHVVSIKGASIFIAISIMDWMIGKTVWITVWIVFHTVSKVCWINPWFSDHQVEILSQTVLINEATSWTIGVTNSTIAFHAVVAAVTILFQTSVSPGAIDSHKLDNHVMKSWKIALPVSVCVKNQASAATAAAIHPTRGIDEMAAIAEVANPEIVVWTIVKIPGSPPSPWTNAAILATGNPIPRATTADLSKSAANWFSLKKLVIPLMIPEASLKNPVNVSNAKPSRFTPCSPSLIPKRSPTKSPTIPNTSPIAEPMFSKVTRILSAILIIWFAASSLKPSASNISKFASLSIDPKIMSKKVWKIPVTRPIWS